MNNEELQNKITDLECELEEMNECGDLEDRMECAMKLERLKAMVREEPK